MSTANRLKQLESEPVSKAVWTLALPTVLSSLIMMIYSLADTYFVGMLNDPVQNAAVTLAAPVLLAFNAINNLFGVGSSSMISRSLGAGNQENARQSASFGVYGSFIASIVFSLICGFAMRPLLTLLGAGPDTMNATISYFKWAVVCGALPAICGAVLSFQIRSEGDSKNASVGVSLGAILNIILDPLFALPQFMGLGAEGVGLATFLSHCVSLIYFLVIIYRKRSNTCIDLKPSKLRPSGYIVRGVCGVGLSASIQNLLNVTGMMILTKTTASYGTNAVAAMGIVQKLAMIPMYIMMGMTQGIAPLVGFSYADGNYKCMRNILIYVIKISLTVSTLSVVLMLTKGGMLTSIFMSNPEIVEIGSHLIKGFSLALPFMGMDFLVVSVFQSLGRGRSALIFAILRKVALEIPALILLNRFFGLYALGFGQAISEFVLAIIAIAVLRKIFKETKTAEA